MNIEELFHRWRKRRREILESLPPDLLAEYRRLGRLIQGMLNEQLAEIRRELKRSKESSEITEQEVRDFRRRAHESIDRAHEMSEKDRRTSLAFRRAELKTFFESHGPATRRQILEATSIPAGSLSELLKGEEFEQVHRGLWRLRMSKKKG
jgi:hypothetical protein